MQDKALAFAVAALLAFGASGVVAASTTSPLATADASPTDAAQPDEYTVEVVDPDDQLSEREVENALLLAWTHDEVRSHFDGESVHFQVEALGDDRQVYVAPSEAAPPRVVADVDLDAEAVTGVEAIGRAMTADDAMTMQLSPVNATDLDGDVTVTVTRTDGQTVKSGPADAAVTLRVANASDLGLVYAVNASGE